VFKEIPTGIPVILMENDLPGGVEADMAFFGFG